MKKFTTALLLSLAISSYARSSDSSIPSNPEGEVAGHGYVDLGLPSGTLWVTCNIDAESPYHPGQYFAWGETKPRDRFIWHDYEFFEEEFTDAQGHTSYSAFDIGHQISGTEYDAARVQWGDAWRVPTKEDFEELMTYCTAEYKEYSSIPPKKGLLITGTNGNSIIIPPTFSPHGGVAPDVLTGEYWTSTADSDTESNTHPSAIMMMFNPSNSKMELLPDGRHEGLSIRPVISRQDISTSVAALTDSTPAIKYDNGTIIINGNAYGCKLTVADLSGRIILASSINHSICLLPELPKGIYIANLYKNGKAVSNLKITAK